MNISLEIPSALLWFAGGLIVGAVLTLIYVELRTRDAIGRMFGW